LQSCALTIKLNSIPITIAAIYSPPKHKITNQILTDYFSTINHNFIAGGDFNAKHQSWGCRANNPRGLVLKNFTSSKCYKVLASLGSTYWSTSIRKNPDILDIFVAKILNNLNYKTENLLEPNSDHSPVMLSVSASPLTHQAPPKLFNSPTDKYKFHNLVDQQIKLNVKLKTLDDIDLAVNNLTQLIQSSAWSSSIKCHPSTHLPQIPEYTRSIIVEKRRARALYQRTRLPYHKQKYNKLANHLKKCWQKKI